MAAIGNFFKHTRSRSQSLSESEQSSSALKDLKQLYSIKDYKSVINIGWMHMNLLIINKRFEDFEKKITSDFSVKEKQELGKIIKIVQSALTNLKISSPKTTLSSSSEYLENYSEIERKCSELNAIAISPLADEAI